MTERSLSIDLDEENSCKVHEVYGFGEPMLVLWVEQDGEECGVNLSVGAAKRLQDWLSSWLEKYP